ncbi:MAG: VWA domain-containing protein [Pseudomonadales bacterium]
MSTSTLDSMPFVDGLPALDKLPLSFADVGYITNPDLAMAISLMGQLQRSLMLEGEAGVGKTEVAKSLAKVLDSPLIRLQCYEGLDANAAVYEWNYQRQLLAIKMWESEKISLEEKEQHIFAESFLLQRPLLQSISLEQPGVLLIDEIDRADEEFEAFLLEVLSDFQISIPELGTIQAKSIPYVILTSNGTRELSDALRRRCLYHYVEYPSVDEELRIINARLPGLEQALVGQVVRFVHILRKEDLVKKPGVTETQDALRILANSITHGGDSLKARLLRIGLRSSLCTCVEEWRRFDEMYDAFWLRRGLKTKIESTGEKGNKQKKNKGSGETNAEAELPTPVEGEGVVPSTDEQASPGTASSAEALAQTDFRYINDPAELIQLHELAARLAAKMRYRLTRRQHVQRQGEHLDLRSSIHKSLAYGGMPFHLAFRKRRLKPLRLVMLLDVSGSMNLYSQFFVRFISGILDKFQQADAFVFHTRLVQISVALRERNSEKAIEKLSLMSTGWSGGTKIGECIGIFNRNYATNIVNTRTVVMIVSDGYDTGSAEVLGEEMQRLKKRAKRIIWLNPMIDWDDYQPIAKGMAAALPSVDLFAAAHNLESLLAIESKL